MLRAQTSPTRPQPSGESGHQSVEPPAWLLRACLTGERMRSHSVSTQEPTLRKTPLHHADLTQSLRAEKVRKQPVDCTLIPRAISSRAWGWAPRHIRNSPIASDTVKTWGHNHNPLHLLGAYPLAIGTPLGAPPGLGWPLCLSSLSFTCPVSGFLLL